MNETIFLQKYKTFNNITTNINIILSPEFYWVRVFDIPIESKKEALNSLPMLFEDFINIDGYKFYIVKLEKNKYLGFAYNEENIKKAIKDSGIQIKKVQGIYFAQNEITNNIENETLLTIEDKNFLLKDGILVQLPMSFTIENNKIIDISQLKLSQNYIILNNFSKYISNKMALSLTIVLLILSSLIFVKILDTKLNISSYEEKIEELKIKNNLPPSVFQTKSILESLDKTEKSYIKLRKILSLGINFKSISNGQLLSVEQMGKKIVFTYTKIDENKLKSYFLKNYKKSSFTKNNDNFIVEIINE